MRCISRGNITASTAPTIREKLAAAPQAVASVCLTNTSKNCSISVRSALRCC